MFQNLMTSDFNLREQRSGCLRTGYLRTIGRIQDKDGGDKDIMSNYSNSTIS